MEFLIGLFFVSLLLFHGLERFAPIKPEYKTGLTRRGYLADFTSSIVNGPVLATITKIVGYWIVMRFPSFGWGMGDWPWFAQFLFFFLVNDLARYWLHRWYHASNFLWRVHRVHHTAMEMDALSTFRIHFLEAVIKYGLVLLPFRFSGIDPMVILIYSAIDIVKGFWHHANLRTYIGPLNYFLNSAELHWWHHSTDDPGQSSNYGSILSIWDRLFGTFYWPKGQWPETIGVHDMERFPETYFGQLASIRLSDAQAAQTYHDPSASSVDRAPRAAGDGFEPRPALADSVLPTGSEA